jgi:hypothetical protein
MTLSQPNTFCAGLESQLSLLSVVHTTAAAWESSVGSLNGQSAGYINIGAFEFAMNAEATFMPRFFDSRRLSYNFMFFWSFVKRSEDFQVLFSERIP